jgi:chaperonin GroES
MKVQPIGERVLIKPKKEEERTKGGIYIPDAAKESKKEGEVYAAGTFKDGKELPVKKGDYVIYSGYSSDDVDIDGEKYVMIEFKDVIAKIIK